MSFSNRRNSSMDPPKPKLDVVPTLESKIADLEAKYQDLLQRITKDSSDDKKLKLSDIPATPANETAGDAEQPVTDEPRALIVLNKVDPESGERKDFKPEDAATSAKVVKVQTTHSFTLRKIIYSDPDDNNSEIEIHSPRLRELLRKLLRDFPGHTFMGDTVQLDSPYEPLVFNWDKLCDESERDDGDEDEKARAELKLLLENISAGSGDTRLDQYLQSRDSFAKQNQKSVLFENLWTIFPPGTIVYGQPFLKQPQVFIVQDNLGCWPSNAPSGRKGRPWSMACWSYDWDGRNFLRKSLKIRIESFEGPKPISSLPYYPFSENKNLDSISEKLKKRGATFRKYCMAKKGERMFEYHGETIFLRKGIRGMYTEDSMGNLDSQSSFSELDRMDRLPPPPDTEVQKTFQEAKGPVMIDFESFYKYGQEVAPVGELIPYGFDSDCDCLACWTNDEFQNLFKWSYDDPKNLVTQWEDLQLMLCPPRVLGYILGEKQWAQLHIDKVLEIPEILDDDPFESQLQLQGEDGGKTTKDLLLGLVKNHGLGLPKSGGKGFEVTDIVPDKGKGLVILLYGPPGVGKTSTALTIAQTARKPLFSVGVADVGTTAKHVEANLNKIFNLATTWGAILLIDEADVFLQSRGRGGIGVSTERNALVSVFLRVLEYYQGILFLTTNQIAQFDVAVQSRINIAIKYEPLDRTQTKDIFGQFLEQYQRQGVVDDIGNIQKYVKQELLNKDFDGRQIRNIVSSAVGLARAQNEKLSTDHVRTVVGNVSEFKKDLNYQMRKYMDAQRGD